jgi:transposase
MIDLERERKLNFSLALAEGMKLHDAAGKIGIPIKLARKWANELRLLQQPVTNFRQKLINEGFIQR